jgi:RNA polymerase sigma factor (sigma-70 family)
VSGSGTGTERTGLELLVDQAKAGDRAALETLVGSIRDQVYNLAIRMLWHPSDAEDATQEILIRIVTHLSSFRGESAFTTWVYRVAANHLLTTRKRRAEREELTFDRFAEQIDEGLRSATPSPAAQVEDRLLVEEVKLGCTQGMLLCLDRDLRLAYILGHVFGLKSDDAAEIAGVSAATFRKRLSRARHRLHGFMQRTCGLVDAANSCRCAGRVNHAVHSGRVDPADLLFAGHPVAMTPSPRMLDAVREMEQLHTAADVLRGHPRYAAPERTTQVLRDLLNLSSLRILDD